MKSLTQILLACGSLWLWLGGTLQAQTSPDQDKLIRQWQLQTVDGDPVDTSDTQQLTIFDENGDNQFVFDANEEAFTGRWQLSDDTLKVSLPLATTFSAIDSVAYAVDEEGKPSILFFHNDKLITRLTQQGIQSRQVTRLFQVNALSKSRLVLTELANGTAYAFSYESRITTSGITFTDVWRGLLGMVVLLLLLVAFSAKRSAIDWQLVATGIGIQLVFAFLVLKVDVVRLFFDYISGFFVLVLSFTYEGSLFLFGDLMDVNTYGYIFAFQVLPTIVFFSALTSILYYLGILQKIVFAFAWIMNRLMHMSGAESLAAAANIFIGQTEAPLVVKPYLEKMTKSELLCLMVGGMATIAGGVFAAYIGFLGGNDPEQMQFFATHLLTASIMSAPAAIVAAKILYPEENRDAIDRTIRVPKDKIGSNLLDAISNGTTDGLKLAINVGVMLLTFTALIYMLNYMLLGIGDWFNLNSVIAEATNGRFEGLSMEYVLGLLLYPISWVLGTPAEDAMLVGQLLGKKTIVNEFVAYQSMQEVKEAGAFLHQKSVIIATYALCGFANFASIGIQIGGIGAIAPSQRQTLAKFGVRALIGGTAAAFLTAVIAGTIV